MLQKKYLTIVLVVLTSLTIVGAMESEMKTKPSNEELKSKLTEIQYKVTQEDGTERPFENEYYNNKRKGIYVDVVTGEALFSSEEKYDSGSGWPSFYKPLNEDNIVTKVDRSLPFQERTEVRSKGGNSHLGHVFEDGPNPTGLRFCINSAALRFIPVEDLEKEGYGEYLKHFQKQQNQKQDDVKTNPTRAKAMFAGGCFWGVEALFSKLEGVIDAVSGYSGGNTQNPTYEQVSRGTTGHAEVVEITYDSSIVSYKTLLEYFFRMHDPTTPNRQGVDVGTQYRSAIYYYNEEQMQQAKEFIEKLEQKKVFKNDIVTELKPATKFYPAEDYHQDYYDKKYEGEQGPICHTLRGPLDV